MDRPAERDRKERERGAEQTLKIKSQVRPTSEVRMQMNRGKKWEENNKILCS